MANSDTDSAKPVASPCVRLCTLDDDDICLGCFRNIDEICAWGSANNDERREIVHQADTRRSARDRRA